MKTIVDDRKAMDLSINMIIIAALALIVLVVMVLVFTGKIGIFSKSSGCTERGGQCMPAESCSQSRTAFSCTKQGEVCCIDPMKLR